MENIVRLINFMIFLLKHKLFGIIFLSKSFLYYFKSKTRFKKFSIPMDSKGVIDTSNES